MTAPTLPICERLREADRNSVQRCLGSRIFAEAADLIQQQQATIERLSAEKVELLNDIAVMMSEFVDNWPQPKKVSTALALIAKTLRAALGKDASDDRSPGSSEGE